MITTIPCDHCAGKGKVPGPATGAALRIEREEAKVGRTPLLANFKRPDGGLYSMSYLIDLERDVRPWSHELVDAYRKAIERAVRQRERALQKEAIINADQR